MVSPNDAERIALAQAEGRLMPLAAESARYRADGIVWCSNSRAVFAQHTGEFVA